MKKISKPELNRCRRVLIVEGYSDLTFYAEFLEHLGKYDGVFIKDMGGRQRLMAELETFIDPPLLATKTRIAVILDNDDNSPDFANRLKAKLEALARRDLTEGQWAEGGLDAKVGFFVAPAPGEVGEIEDLAWAALNLKRVDPGLPAEANEFVEKTKSLHKPKTMRIAKRRLGSLLAICHEDDPRLGPAAQAKLIDFDAPALARLKAFLSGF